MKDKNIKTGISEIKNISMTDAEKKHIYSNILKFSEKSPTIKSQWSFYLFTIFSENHRLAYFIVIPLVFILSGAGVVFASTDSLPDNFLYPVKVRVLEPIEGALAFTSKAKAVHESKLANKRLLEAENLAQNGKLSEVNEKKINSLLATHTSSLDKALNKIEKEDSSSEEVEDIVVNFRAQMNAHAKILDSLSEKDKDNKDKDSLKISNTARVSADNIKKSSERTEKDNLEKYKNKKIKVKNLIDVTDMDNTNYIKSDDVEVDDSNDSIEKAKAYLYDADQKDQEGKIEEAYSSLLDSESSIKEAKIMKDIEKKINKNKDFKKDKREDD